MHTIPTTQPAPINTAYRSRRWLPEQVLFTPAALDESWGQQILERVQSFNLPVKYLKQNRLTGLRGETERETYTISKRTLAVVTAPPSQLKLSPIPPSADWQFHLAQGCPAHCQYCYLAGSLQGPPVIRVYANLPQIWSLDKTMASERSALETDRSVGDAEKARPNSVRLWKVSLT
jgi:spore photoproduct lyase